MKRHGVGRFVGHATPAVLDPQGSPTLITRLIEFMPRTFMPRAYEEITGMSNQIMSSGLDWTIVRFIAPKDCAPKGHIRSGSSAPTSSASRSPAPASPPSPPIRSARAATCIAQAPSATDHRRNLNGDLCPSSSPLPPVTSAEQPSKPSSTAAPTPPR
ncbi:MULTISPECIES: Rossmann-fold NAD(P)-binding domain-containing protein [Nocardia]|uniref:NAD(P)-binding domain-containing protein n=2 Tax=Nocardia TaxID=1817 RepID=U5E905_NOCAS|nr:hypothetical protein NCAST_14_00065 [Nocardia asteroides NBRC 15531]